jgi:hypothetical protein
MHEPTRRQTSRRQTTSTRRAPLLGALLSLVSIVFPGGTASAAGGPTASVTERHPHVLHGAVADVLVRVHGGGACSGTPIRGTRNVVTAAHCVLDPDGRPGRRTVERDGIQYPAVAVLVDTRYHGQPEARFDAAVLVLERPLPGPAATIAEALPTSGSVTLAGFQALDSDGSLLRGSGPHDALRPKGATGNLISIATAPAGCVQPVAALTVTATVVEVDCGLIPGASGGGLFVADGDSVTLVGITSSVWVDLTANGVVPLTSLHELLQHPARYTHDLTTVPRPAPVHTTLS